LPVGLIIGIAVSAIVVIGLAVGALWYLGRGAGAPRLAQAAGATTPAPAGTYVPRKVPAGDSPMVSLENFKRIRPDMTQAQVEVILGPGVRVLRTEILRVTRSKGPPGRTDSTVLKWQNGRDILLLELTERERQGVKEPLGVRAGWYVTENQDGTVSTVLLGAVQPH
jgi:hypothetical protein